MNIYNETSGYFNECVCLYIYVLVLVFVSYGRERN